MDTNKAEKLAAAKKKLKQFQQKAGSVPKNTNREPLHLIQQLDQSLIGSSIVEHEIHPFHSEEEHNGESANDSEVIQLIETLTKEKNNLLASNLSYKQLVLDLERKLNEEKEVFQKENEASKLVQQELSNQRSSREEELQNTISFLIEEKNLVAKKDAYSQEKIKVLEEELFIQRKEYEDTKRSLELLKVSNFEDISLLQSKLSTSTKEYEEIHQELSSMQQLHNDASEELKQLQIQKNSQADELLMKENTIKELKTQLELLDVNLQQLKNAGPPTVDQSLEKMQRENSKILEEVEDLKEQLKKLGTEKDVLAQQYQQYILRLNGQIRTITSQAESAALEKRNVEAALEATKDQIVHLESLISGLKQEKLAPEQLIPVNQEVTTSTDFPPAETEQNTEELVILRKQLAEMNLNNDELAKLILEKEARIQELEIRIDRIQSELSIATASNDHHEKEKLLQAMQGDKSAASRAIGQNRQLKRQLEELENAFIQLSNDKLALTEESQAVIAQNKEFSERFRVMEPELMHLRQEVQELKDQRSATIYWKQELEEAHERIQALSHQNSELKKRVVWNVNQVSSPANRKHRGDKNNLDTENNLTSSSSENGDDEDWVPSEEHQKLLFHFGQLEQKLQRSMTSISELTDEKQKLEHLVLQLQSETETIGEYVSLYQVQRGLLRRRAEQLTNERLKLKERIVKLSHLLPHLAPQLKTLPQWKQLNETDLLNENDGSELVVGTPTTIETEDEVQLTDIVTRIVDVLSEISSSSMTTNDFSPSPISFELDDSNHGPHENFHPCLVCSGRLMTV